jgi:hypothetical protein
MIGDNPLPAFFVHRDGIERRATRKKFTLVGSIYRRFAPNSGFAPGA